MRSKGSHFTLGFVGLRVCSLDVAFASAAVRNRPQLSATVCNRPQASASVRVRAVPLAVLQLRLLGGFKRRGASFRVAGAL